MNTNVEIWRQQIRQAMRESIGLGCAVSVAEATEITGLHKSTIYQMASGTMRFPDMHLMKLLDIPAFADRLMSIRGHACTFIGNEQGCPWQAIGAVMEATGEGAEIVADRKITDPEKKRLADRLHVVIRKAQAYLHRFHRERLQTRVGA